MGRLDLLTLLNIVSTLSIVGALLFAALQVRAADRARRDFASVTLIQTTQSEIWTRTLEIVSRVKENASVEDIEQSPEETRHALFEFSIRLETIGYMVYRRMVQLATVDELMGGVVLMYWSRAKDWAIAERHKTGNPKMQEWCQWLATQVAQRHAKGGGTPAYLRDRGWRE